MTKLLELKDTISQLNHTINTQNELIRALQKMLQERDARDSEKDKMIANLQAQLDYLKTKLLGSTSEIRHDQLPGQLNRNRQIIIRSAIKITPALCKLE